jgi:hypothetical protein
MPRLVALLRRTWLPYAVLGVALVATPLVVAVSAAGQRARYQDEPPPCYGIGWGCSLDPESVGLLMGGAYVVALAGLLLIVGLLHLGGPKLALARSILAAGPITAAWCLIGVGTVARWLAIT